MNKTIRNGRLKFLIIASLYATQLIAVTLTYLVKIGFDNFNKQLIRFIVTGLLLTLTYKGSNIARKLFVIYLFLNIAFFLIFNEMLPTYALIYSAVFLPLALYLKYSKDISEFINYQKSCDNNNQK